MRSLTRLAAFVSFVAPLLGPSAHAFPILHQLTPASTFSAQVTLAGVPTVRTNLGNVALPSFTLSGALADTPTGSMAVDWGAPSWDDALAIPTTVPSFPGPDVPGIDVLLADEGSLDGAFHVDLFGLLSVDIGFQWVMDSISIAGGGFSGPTVPSDGNAPGTGPWTAMGLLDAVLELEGEFQVTVFGLHPGTGGSGDVALNDHALSLTLGRIGGLPGTGTRASVDIDVPGALQLPSSVLFPASGCEVPDPIFGGCIFDFEGVEFEFTTAQLTDLSIFLEATSRTPVLPEPAGPLLAGVAISCLLARRRQAR
jgi:hypothetical protein